MKFRFSQPFKRRVLRSPAYGVNAATGYANENQVRMNLIVSLNKAATRIRLTVSDSTVDINYGNTDIVGTAMTGTATLNVLWNGTPLPYETIRLDQANVIPLPATVSASAQFVNLDFTTFGTNNIGPSVTPRVRTTAGAVINWADFTGDQIVYLPITFLLTESQLDTWISAGAIQPPI
jgi:hypothetical protein